MRNSQRNFNETRTITFLANPLTNAEGSCIIEMDGTKVICCASIEENVPRFLKGTGKGWVTAEYGMLPRSTHSRMRREAKTSQSGRTQEIQRLIGRSLRAVIDFKKLGERQIIIDCDVLEANGGTRTASITGGFIALRLAIQHLLNNQTIKENPLMDSVAAISAGVVNGAPMIDLDYSEDSCADIDANFVFTGSGKLIELQASAEKEPFSEEILMLILSMAKKACADTTILQNKLFKNV